MTRAPLLALAVFAVGCGGATSSGADPAPCSGPATRFISCVLDFDPGKDAGYGMKDYPEVIFGPPHGQGEYYGDTDSVLSLGKGGVISVGFGANEIVDGDGPDFIVFENPFRLMDSDQVFAEPGQVSVSEDGEAWTSFPCDPSTLKGCAGVNPVLSNPDNDISPFDPKAAGGDAFDLRDVGLSRARYVRVVDESLMPPGSNDAGFDLDAMSIVNASDP